MQAFRKISAIVLAFLVMYSSTSYSLNMHFCMDELANISLFETSDTCKMEEVKPACHKTDQPVIEAKSCCNDQSIIVEAQDEVTSASIIKAPLIQLLVVTTVLLPELLLIEDSQSVAFRAYIPPILVKNIPVTYEQFLI